MPRTDQPTISVAMTTYQAGGFLEPQLASIAAQTVLPAELVVYDDASIDGSWQVLTDFAAQAPFKCRLQRQQENVGLRRNVEGALSACAGEVIVLADQDDLWEPEKLAAVEEAFGEPDVTLWFSDGELVDDTGQTLHRRCWDAVGLSTTEARALDSEEGLRRLLHGMTVTGATMAVRRDVLGVALPLPAELEGEGHLFLHDGWLAALAAVHGRVVADPRPLTRYRQHPHQVTAMSLASPRQPADDDTPAQRAGGVRGARRQDLLIEHARVGLVARRLRQQDSDLEPLPGKAAYLHDLEHFLDVRSLPRSAKHRRRRIVGLLTSGAYHRHARGIRTALLDLQ